MSKETLEQAAERYSEGNDLEDLRYANMQAIHAFKEGANWQQKQDLLEEAAERIFPKDITQETFKRLRTEKKKQDLLKILKPNTENQDLKNAIQVIDGLRLLTDTFTYDELRGIIEQLYYVKKQEKLEYYFDQIKLNAKGCDTMSAFQYGYFDTLSALGEN